MNGNTEVPFPFREFSIRLPIWQTANTPNSQKNGTADIQRITIPSTLKRCMAKWHFLNNLSSERGICKRLKIVYGITFLLFAISTLLVAFNVEKFPSDFHQYLDLVF